MTITKLAFQFFMMNIEHKMKLKLTIVIGFGAKIWNQLLEKGEIQNIFFLTETNFSYMYCYTKENKFNRFI